MKLKTLGLLGLTVFLAACAGATAEDAPDTPIAQVAPTATLEPASVPIPLPTEAQPTRTPTDAPEADCGDPFEGETVRFRRSVWTKTNFCKHSVPYAEIRSGGPPPDGIPPIDEPRFETVTEADAWLGPNEPVIAFELDGVVRAYPLQILTWHEIVNDEVAGVPVAVTFCPLCNAAIVFDRRVGDQVLSFGTTGNLRNSDLVMWDRQTESWWQQFTGEAIVGDFTGTQLAFMPATIVAWTDFKSAYPDGEVLSKMTGFARNYGVNPYAGYDNIEAAPWAFEGRTDARLPAMARVATVELDGVFVAYPFDVLAEQGVVNDVVGDWPLVVFWKSGTASALDEALIRNSRDIGSTAIFDSAVDGQTLTFTSEGEFFKDDQTGSTWNLLGEAVDGPLAGERLARMLHHEYFWFAWAAFRPDTIVYGGEP